MGNKQTRLPRWTSSSSASAPSRLLETPVSLPPSKLRAQQKSAAKTRLCVCHKCSDLWIHPGARSDDSPPTRHCRGGRQPAEMALYRCQLLVDQPVFKSFKTVESRARLLFGEEVNASDLGLSAVELCILKFLEPYLWKRVVDCQTNKHYLQFVACKRCITADVVWYFTFVATGWQEQEIKDNDRSHVSLSSDTSSPPTCLHRLGSQRNSSSAVVETRHGTSLPANEDRLAKPKTKTTTAASKLSDRTWKTPRCSKQGLVADHPESTLLSFHRTATFADPDRGVLEPTSADVLNIVAMGQRGRTDTLCCRCFPDSALFEPVKWTEQQSTLSVLNSVE